MTTCIFTLGIISCVVTGPKLTPAEAVRILSASSPPFMASVQLPSLYERDSMRYRSEHARSSSGTPWDWPVSAPSKRLDGTSYTTPTAIYGLPPRWANRPSHMGIGRTR
jgi:hypothetical protein